MLAKPSYIIETKSGILGIRSGEDGRFFMEQNPPRFYETINENEISGCFSVENFYKEYPIQIVSTGLRDILFPIPAPKALESLVPDFEAISRISREKDCVGIHAFSFAEDSQVTAICRNFAPLYGILEESATGTSNCALACYLFHYGMKQESYLFEQGYSLNSVSRIYVNVKASQDIITGVFVGGNGFLLGKKRI